MLKRHLLLITLVFSLLINAAGIFFFIAFLETRGHLRHVKKERNIATQNLFMMRGQVRTNSVMASDDVIKCTFVSHFDGQVDKFAYLPPSNLKTTGGFKLIVYLHGMGSTFLEPFISPETQSVASEIRNNNPDLVFASVNYRGGVAWISDAAMADISQNIRELMQRYPISKIVMMGTSMGGTISLTYAAIAPPDIKSKIIGVVSSEGAGDLAEVYRLTENQSLKPALANAFGGPPEAVPERYARRSLLPNIDRLEPNVRIAVISARQDSIVPPQCQRNLEKALAERTIPTKLMEVDEPHGIPNATLYLEGLKYVLGRRSS